jgi:hypothetical protein
MPRAQVGLSRRMGSAIELGITPMLIEAWRR